MPRCSTARTLAACLSLLSCPAWAQVDRLRAGHRADLGDICAQSLEQFCPALADGPAQLRNQVICLRPYRSSLPLACRKAVTAALH